MARGLKYISRLIPVLAVALIASLWFISPPLATAQSQQDTTSTNTQQSTTDTATTNNQSTNSSTQTTTTTPSTASGTSITADGICKGILSAETGQFFPDATAASCKESGETGLGVLVRRIINIFSIVVGAVAVIMVIIGGFRYIISGGDSSGVQAAKNTILYAIVGLVIVIFAQIIVRFVFTTVAPAATG